MSGKKEWKIRERKKESIMKAWIWIKSTEILLSNEWVRKQAESFRKSFQFHSLYMNWSKNISVKIIDINRHRLFDQHLKGNEWFIGQNFSTSGKISAQWVLFCLFFVIDLSAITSHAKWNNENHNRFVEYFRDSSFHYHRWKGDEN